ncbi:MAG: hypothetical protein U5J83_04560 [Bryobacterales bacterium]|nr:hypothetical protein [Bryobacterales bacterium]
MLAAGALALWDDSARGMGAVAAALLLLVAVIVQHEMILRKVEEGRRRMQYWADGIDRLDDRWAGRGIPGNAFLEDHHLYAADLDLFGKGSVFELLCSARTALGERRLADWLLNPSETAVAEASSNPFANFCRITGCAKIWRCWGRTCGPMCIRRRSPNGAPPRLSALPPGNGHWQNCCRRSPLPLAWHGPCGRCR